MIGNKIADTVAKSYDGRIIKVWRCSRQKTSGKLTNESDKEIPKERYNLKKKTRNYWWSEINIIMDNNRSN